MPPASLAVPAQGQGRSRFSKALPAIPPIDTSVAAGSSTAPSLSSNIPPVASNNTVTSLGNLPPPPPPPHDNDPRVPIQYTPLPPIPITKPINTTTTTPTTPTSGPSKMAIPRRPVGARKPVPVRTTQTQTQTPSQSQAAPPAPPQSRVAQPEEPEQESPGPLSLDVLDSFPLPAQSSPPQPVIASASRGKEQEQEQEQLGRQEPKPQLTSEKAQTRSQPHIQLGKVHPQPSPAEAAAAPNTNAASNDIEAPQEPPDPKPQTAEYLLPSELPQPMKSPSDSLSSILSAYSRSSTQSIIRSSDGTYSTRDSHAQDSPSKYHSSSTIHSSSSYHETSASISTLTPNTAAQQTARPPPHAIANGNNSAQSPPAPPPPSKDSPAQRPTSPPSRGPSGNNSELVTPSPPKQQIWRRRSLKGSRELPDLRLNYSHGSTASTASTATTQSQSTVVPEQNQGLSRPRAEAAAPPPPPKGAFGLPGRDVRPAHSREQSEEKTTMGHGGSRLKQLKDKFHLSRRSDASNTGSNAEVVQTESGNGEQNNRPNAYRPPTPEYQKQDLRTPIVETFISPISPASSPEPPKQSIAAQSQPLTAQPSEAEDLPPPPPAKSTDRALSRKRVPVTSSTARDAIPAVDGSSEPKPATTSITSPTSAAEPKRTQLTSPVAGPPLHPTKSLPDLKTRFTPSPTTEPLPPASAFPSSGRNSPAPDGFPGRGRRFEPPGRPASRESSARPESRRGFDPIRNPGPDGSRFVRSSTGELLYRGRDGTLYPEMKESQEPNPKAAQFPAPPGQVPAEGTIFEAAPLRDAHYQCYQKHRAMLRRNNRRYPLTCQTCLKADTEDRWACTFCSLRVCESCLGLLESNKKDLSQLMTALASSRTLSLSSPNRPGSALGLSMTTERQ